MAVRLRLMRMGKHKRPFYRLVAADARSPRDGRAIEILGQYDPLQEPSLINVDRERVLWWLERGAQCSEPVEKLLRIQGIMEEFEKARESRGSRARQGGGPSNAG
jgi:small subunit ribosomal protein S16